MLHINVANVLNMLIILFQITHIPPTPINEREIQLRDVIKDIITNAVNDLSFDVHTHFALKFQNYLEVDLPDIEYVTDKVEEFLENDNVDYEPDNEYNCEPEDEILNSSYKRKAVEYWRSDKRPTLSFRSATSLQKGEVPTTIIILKKFFLIICYIFYVR